LNKTSVAQVIIAWVAIARKVFNDMGQRSAQGHEQWPWKSCELKGI